MRCWACGRFIWGMSIHSLTDHVDICSGCLHIAVNNKKIDKLLKAEIKRIKQMFKEDMD